MFSILNGIYSKRFQFYLCWDDTNKKVHVTSYINLPLINDYIQDIYMLKLMRNIYFKAYSDFLI